MPVTSFYPEFGNRWLTSFGADAAEGDEPTISVGHPFLGGEFTTYRLGVPVGTNKYGEPLFDEDDLGVVMDGFVYPRAELRALRQDWSAREHVLNGIRYVRGVFGNFRRVREEKAA